MGWGRMFFLGNWGQQMDIEDQREEIEDLRQQVQSIDRPADTAIQARVAQLELENSELRLYLAALVNYFGHKDEFSQLIEMLDNEDGQADRGYRGPIMK